MSDSSSSQSPDQPEAQAAAAKERADTLNRLDGAHRNYCAAMQRVVGEGQTNLAAVFQRYQNELVAARCQLEPSQEAYRKLVNELIDAGKNIHSLLRDALTDYIETIRAALADAETKAIRPDTLASIGAGLQNVAYWSELARSNLHNSLVPWIPGGMPN